MLMPMKKCAVPECDHQIPEHYPDVCGGGHTEEDHAVHDDDLTRLLRCPKQRACEVKWGQSRNVTRTRKVPVLGVL